MTQAIFLSAVRALVGNIVPEVCGVLISADESTIYLVGLTKERPTEEAIEAIQIAGTEIMAEFFDDLGIDEFIVSINDIPSLPKKKWFYVYLQDNIDLGSLNKEAHLF